MPLCYCDKETGEHCILCKPWILTLEVTNLIENWKHKDPSNTSEFTDFFQLMPVGGTRNQKQKTIIKRLTNAIILKAVQI